MTPAPTVVKRVMGKVPLLVHANMNAQRMDTNVNFVTQTTTWRVFAAAKITQSPLLLLRTARVPFFNALCTVTDSGRPPTGRQTIPLDHHVYDNLSDTWHMKRSSPQPFVNVTIKIVATDYTNLGFDLSAPSLTCQIPAMADTGCQSCLAGMKVICRLGLRTSNLIPVTMRMHTVNNGGITILGATILRISGTDNQGKILETRQMTYITDSSDKLFLSKEACIALEMIPHTFPIMGVATSPHTMQHAALHEDQTKPAPVLGASSLLLPPQNCHSLLSKKMVCGCNSFSLTTTSPALSTPVSTKHCPSWTLFP